MKILGLIPARSGSKGIPMKNIKKLNGKPLIAYTILSALKSKKINKILVRTDSKKIASISKKFGAEIPFLRPKELSNDVSKTIDVVKHSLKFLYENESYVPDIIVILQPTSPLRTSQMIDKSITMLKNSNVSCVLGVKKISQHPYNSFWNKQNLLKPFTKNFQNYPQRQNLPELLYPTGSIYTFWRKTIEETNSYYGKKILPYVLPEENSIDIDTLHDFFLAESIMRKLKK